MNSKASQANRRMIKTAYELALHLQLPLKLFKLLVKCQRIHGVALISGKDDNNAVSEYLGFIAAAIQEKVAVIMASSHFLSLLSQARNTGSNKELVVIRIERGGIPVYITLSLLEMSDFGGTATADGASVNFGACNGLLTKIGATRPWLLKIHCSNHRTKLAIKKVFSKKSRIYMWAYLTFTKILENFRRKLKRHAMPLVFSTIN